MEAHPVAAKRRREDDDDDDGSAVGGAAAGGGGGSAEEKRSRVVPSTALVVRADASAAGGALIVASGSGAVPVLPRASSLEAPNMLLTGHGSGVNALAFDATGKWLASASRDKTLLLWSVASGAIENTAQLKGHSAAVTDVAWAPDASQLYSASADKHAAVWDAETATRVRTLRGHGGIVNALSANRRGEPLVASVADDGSCRLWDPRSKACAQVLAGGRDKGASALPLLAVALSDDSSAVFAAGIDGPVRQWEVRRGAVAATFAGHTDSVTCLRLSPSGRHLLSQGMDHTVRAWDVRPFVPGKPPAAGAGPAGAADGRCVRVFTGSSANFEQNLLRCDWSGDGELVAAGSADRQAYVWDFESGALRYILPGHAGAVTAAAFNPKEPVLATCGTDKRIFLGELALAS